MVTITTNMAMTDHDVVLTLRQVFFIWNTLYESEALPQSEALAPGWGWEFQRVAYLSWGVDCVNVAGSGVGHLSPWLYKVCQGLLQVPTAPTRILKQHEATQVSFANNVTSPPSETAWANTGQLCQQCNISPIWNSMSQHRSALPTM